jgi:MtfA peptidase
MLTRLWRRIQAQREQAAVDRRVIPDDLWKRTRIRYPFLQRRDPADEASLRRLTSLFLDRKEFSGADGLRVSNDIAVAIAAQACLPVLKLGLQRYDGFVGIVVHRDAVRARRQHLDESGVQHEYEEALAGEAMEGGPIMLSWSDVRRAGRGQSTAYNVVIHEFAHVLDLADGQSDGIPLLPPDLPRAEWLATLHGASSDLARQIDAGESSTLDPYAAQGVDEFFAVASEAFFVTPAALLAEHPALYDVLSRFYRQDPVTERVQPATVPAARQTPIGP